MRCRLLALFKLNTLLWKEMYRKMAYYKHVTSWELDLFPGDQSEWDILQERLAQLQSLILRQISVQDSIAFLQKTLLPICQSSNGCVPLQQEKKLLHPKSHWH